MTRLSQWAVLGATVLSLGCGGAQEAPQNTGAVTQPPAAAAAVPPAVSINALMVDWVDHSAHAMWSAEVQAPKDEASWREVERHATQLAAAGTTISLGGTGQADPGWAKSPLWRTYSQQLTDAGLDGFKAARNRNIADLTTINGRLLASCESCHKEFKPDSPTEGRVHDPE